MDGKPFPYYLSTLFAEKTIILVVIFYVPFQGTLCCKSLYNCKYNFITILRSLEREKIKLTDGQMEQANGFLLP